METNYSYKYSIKIIKFLDQNLKEINKFTDPITKNLNDKLFDDLYTLVTSTYKKNYNYHSQIYKIYKIHEANQYPLLFIFFCKLYECETFNDIINFKNICNFNEFIKWYRRNHIYIDFNSVHDRMKNLDKSKHNDLLQLYYLIYRANGHRSNLHELLYHNKFVSIDVQHHAESVDMLKHIYKTNEFNLVLYYPETCSKYYLNINKIIHVIEFMNGLGKMNNSTNYPDICIFAGLQRKQISNNNENILYPENINSGSSIRGIQVRIWRFEEVYKVLIHELIHFHKLDFCSYNNEYSDKLTHYLINTYNIVGFDSPNESYTETLAVIIHSLFMSFYYGYNINDIIRYEINFTLFQITKLLRYFGIKKIDELGHKQFNQMTSAFSYFIVKGSFLISLPMIFDYINHDIRNLSIENKTDSFAKLVELTMNKKYFELIDHIINLTENINIDKDQFIMKTLRMTCFQL